MPKITVLDNYEKLIDPVTNCWIWMGAKNKAGYGQVRRGRKCILVHRFSAHLYLDFDLSQSSMLVCHKKECKNRDCFNPDHLYIGTDETNRKDTTEQMTHCKHGHEYTPENTCNNRLGSRPARCCRICKNLLAKKIYQERGKRGKAHA